MPTVPVSDTRAADLLRNALDPDDLADLGVRDDGPLGWIPDDAPAPADRVTRGRLTHRARRKIARDDQRRRATRAFLKVAA